MHNRNLKHYPELYPEFVGRLPTDRLRAADPEFNRAGGGTSGLKGSVRLIGIMDYLMKGDIKSFRKGVSEGASLELSQYVRFDAGEPINPSYVSMMGYKELFDALGAGDFETARALSDRLGGRPEIEKEFDHPFTIALGYLLKSFVDGDGENVKRDRIEAFRQCQGRNWGGYTQLFEAILNDDLDQAQAAFPEIIAGHKRESKGQGMSMFDGSEDQFLSVWGIGMANLARSHGLPVQIDDPLIPADLLV